MCDNLFRLPTSLFLWFLLHAALSRAAFFLSQMRLLLFPFLIIVIALCPCIFKFVSQALRIPLMQHVSGWLCSVYPCSVYGRVWVCEAYKWEHPWILHSGTQIPGVKNLYRNIQMCKHLQSSEYGHEYIASVFLGEMKSGAVFLSTDTNLNELHIQSF